MRRLRQAQHGACQSQSTEAPFCVMAFGQSHERTLECRLACSKQQHWFMRHAAAFPRRPDTENVSAATIDRHQSLYVCLASLCTTVHSTRKQPVCAICLYAITFLPRKCPKCSPRCCTPHAVLQRGGGRAGGQVQVVILPPPLAPCCAAAPAGLQRRVGFGFRGMMLRGGWLQSGGVTALPSPYLSPPALSAVL